MKEIPARRRKWRHFQRKALKFEIVWKVRVLISTTKMSSNASYKKKICYYYDGEMLWLCFCKISLFHCSFFQLNMPAPGHSFTKKEIENGNLQFFPFLEFCWQRCILYFTIVLPILYIAFPTLQNSISNMIDLNNDTFLETLRYWQNELYGRPKNVQLMFIFGIFKKDNKLFFLLFWYDFYLFALYCLRGHWELLLWPRTSHEAS